MLRILLVLTLGGALGLHTGCGARDDGPAAQQSTQRAVAAAAPAVAAATAPEAPAQRPDVLVLVLDACRPDKMGSYGFGRDTTPELDAVAADPDSVLFRRHYVQAPATKASTASLFTGLHVRQHGVIQALEFEEGNPIFQTERLDSSFETLAEHFQAAGYFTFGVVKSWHLIAEYGYARGFDVYDSPRNHPGSDKNRTERMLGHIRAAPQPYFGYVHLNACHHPFQPKLRDEAYLERFGFEYDEAARQAEGIDFTVSAAKTRILKGEIEPDEADERYLHLLYESKMRGADKNFVGRLVAMLRETGRWDRTLLIVTADHGEELYEHGGYAHGYALWEEITHVPLIVKFPAGERPEALPREVAELTRSIDLTVSLIRWLGRTPGRGMSGVSLFDGEFADFAIAERARQGHMLVRGDYKLIDDRGRRLYQLVDDPRERNDLAASEPALTAELRASARAQLTELAEVSAQAEVIEKTVDPAEIEALRSLGYVE